MAHQNFSVDIHQSENTFAYSNGVFRSNYVAVAKRAEETTVGVTRKKPTGFLDPTAYEYTKKNYVFQHGSCKSDPTPANPNDSVGQLYTGVVGSPAIAGSMSRFSGLAHFDAAVSETTLKTQTELRNQALIAVRNKLKSTDINLGVAYGERNRTARLIGDTASRLARSVRALRRGRIRQAMDELGISSRRGQPRGQNVPQRWLELQYGWRPLLSDVYGAASALEKRSKGDWRVTAKATKGYSQEWLHVFTDVGMSDSRASADISVFARLDALPQNEAIISLASLGVTNPLSVAWELVPFSFVVDWFYPIGSFVSSIDAMLGYGTAYYSSSLLVKAKWVDTGRTGMNGSAMVTNNFEGTKELVYLKREVSTSVPLPSLPGFKDPRSLGHMANGLALLAQVFGRSR